jgi:acyl-CoA thioesterase
MSVALGAVPVDRRWTGYDGYFGGYVVGLLVDAAAAASTYQLSSISVNFVSRVLVGDLSIDVERVHRGRSTELLRLMLWQAGRIRVHATAELLHAAAAQAGEAPHTWVRTSGPPSLPAKDIGLGRHSLPFDGLIELRPASPPRIDAETTSWARFRAGVSEPGLVTDEAVVAALLDMPTPGLFGVPEPPAFVPSVDYTVHFAPRLPMDRTHWVRLDHATAWVTRHHCVDEVTAWSASGRVLATVRQTRSVRWPAPRVADGSDEPHRERQT